MRVAEGTHTRLRPAVQAACSFSRSIEHTGNSLIRHQACTGTDQVNRFGLDNPTRLTSSVLPHREADETAPLPEQHQVSLVAVAPGHPLLQEHPDDTLCVD